MVSKNLRLLFLYYLPAKLPHTNVRMEFENNVFSIHFFKMLQKLFFIMGKNQWTEQKYKIFHRACVDFRHTLIGWLYYNNKIWDRSLKHKFQWCVEILNIAWVCLVGVKESVRWFGVHVKGNHQFLFVFCERKNGMYVCFVFFMAFYKYGVSRFFFLAAAIMIISEL